MSERTIKISGTVIGGVWIFPGLYSKLLNGTPPIAQSSPPLVGEDFATPVTKLVGLGEVFLGRWIWSRAESLRCDAHGSAGEHEHSRIAAREWFADLRARHVAAQCAADRDDLDLGFFQFEPPES